MGKIVLAVALALLTALPAAFARGEVDPVANGEFEVAAREARPHTCAAVPERVKVFPAGTGLPWLASVDGCESSAITAAQWSHGAAVEFLDVDGDGDHEARTRPGVVDPDTGSHTMWQAYANAHQAFLGDFEALEFRVEGGTVPTSAFVQFVYSASPVGDQHPWVGIFFECRLTLPRATLEPDADGVVRVSPLEGTFRSAYETCDDQAAAWNAPDATDEDRRAVLAGLRVVQHSYWRFHASEVVLDGVSIRGARTVAEADLP